MKQEDKDYLTKELIKFLENNLRIELSSYHDWYEDEVEVTLYLKDKEISSSKMSL